MFRPKVKKLKREKEGNEDFLISVQHLNLHIWFGRKIHSIESRQKGKAGTSEGNNLLFKIFLLELI